MNHAFRYLAIGILAALAGCQQKTDRTGLMRRPISPTEINGWVRLPLDGQAQRALPEIWLSDSAGVSIPFELERDDLWQPQQLTVSHLLLGSDPFLRPTAEFSLELPSGWQVRDREHLQVELALKPDKQGAPWVCRIEVQRRLKGKEFLKLERENPLYVYWLGGSGQENGVVIPWDGQDYRLTLVAEQGSAPRITGITVTAQTCLQELRTDQRIDPQQTEKRKETGSPAWHFKLPNVEQLVAAEVRVRPPLAPVKPVFEVRNQKAERRRISSQGAVWNIPALSSSSTHVILSPTLTSHIDLVLPEGAQMETVHFWARRDVLVFPAEAHKTYFLHLGGQAKTAPGNLSALPDSSRLLYSQKPLQLGSPESDPQGIPRIIATQEDQTRRWLPWIAGAAVAVLGFFAMRLLRDQKE